jgi:hypothetical protein
MIELNFFQVLGLTAVAFLAVMYAVCVCWMIYDIIKFCIDGIKLLKHYRFYKKIKPGDIFEYEGKVIPDNPFDDLYYLSRIKIIDIRDKHIKYTIDYIVSDDNGKFDLEKPRSRFTRVEKWWFVMDQRELTKYNKITQID